MEITKNMKAGYQGKKDSMREMAERLLNHPGHAKDVYPSKSAANKEKMRPYKKGGHVKNNMEHEKMETKKEEKREHKKRGGSVKGDCQKFAMGGVAKIRHEEATSQGLPKKFKKKSLKDIL
jgi:hypothetical protein